ncbi:MAG: TolC family protein [Myxococcales bacterium]
MLGLVLALAPLEAQALQPMEEFLTKARSHNYDARVQQATEEQRDWEVQAAIGRLLPSLSARGVYQRNEFPVSRALAPGAKPTVLTPQDQLDAYFQVDVPLLDLSSFHKITQARHLAQAADEQSDVVATDVQRSISRSYYSFIGASALQQAAEQSLQMAQANADFVAVRHEAGVALALDLERARANVERARQDVADANLLRVTAARNLETLSGLTPTPVGDFEEDDLHSEGELNAWLSARDTPAERAQRQQVEAAKAGRRAARSSLLPTLSANGVERITNATGFAGQSNFYTLQAVAAWKLDYVTYANARAQSAALGTEQIRAERTRRQVEDAIFDAYQRVQAGLAKSASARAQADAAQKAASLASERYQAGAVTQLDVTQSQRDAFQAQAARIQADADLAYARVALRTAAGKSPTTSSAASASPSAASN